MQDLLLLSLQLRKHFRKPIPPRLLLEPPNQIIRLLIISDPLTNRPCIPSKRHQLLPYLPVTEIETTVPCASEIFPFPVTVCVSIVTTDRFEFIEGFSRGLCSGEIVELREGGLFEFVDEQFEDFKGGGNLGVCVWVKAGLGAGFNAAGFDDY